MWHPHGCVLNLPSLTISIFPFPIPYFHFPLSASLPHGSENDNPFPIPNFSFSISRIQLLISIFDFHFQHSILQLFKFNCSTFHFSLSVSRLSFPDGCVCVPRTGARGPFPATRRIVDITKEFHGFWFTVTTSGTSVTGTLGHLELPCATMGDPSFFQGFSMISHGPSWVWKGPRPDRGAPWCFAVWPPSAESLFYQWFFIHLS